MVDSLPGIKNNSTYDVVVVGAGLAGLTSAYYLKKLKPDLNILVIERSGTAGGLTGDWVDHRFGPDKRLQSPMHMIFRAKYPNLVHLINEIGGTISELNKNFTIIGGDEVRHELQMDDFTARKLPAPFHALGMFWKLNLSIRDKWDLFKLAAVSTYCAIDILKGNPEPKRIPNTISLESLELILNMGKRSRDFMEAITPSIYNLHPWYTSAPRMASVMAGTMTMTRDSLHYHIFNKNYNAAFIDKFVETLKSMGVEFRFWTEVRRIESKDGSKVDSVFVKSNDPQIYGENRYICENCGAENYFSDRAFCTRCGRDTTLDLIRTGKIQKPVGSELWKIPEDGGYEEIPCQHLITAMYPHMIAKLLPIHSPLRKYPYVRSCFSARTNQTQLSIGRVYYKKFVTEKKLIITGTHNPVYAFNGSQSVMNNFGPEDLGYDKGDVIDVLLDVGVIRDSHTHKEQIERIVKDLHRVYPGADPSLVEHVSFANIYPDVLYHSEQPAITNLHRFFSTHRTGASNWYVAGCHSGLIGIGMESAVESAMSTVNCLFEDMKAPERLPIKLYKVALGSRLLGQFGKALFLWKRRFRSLRRLTESNYS